MPRLRTSKWKRWFLRVGLVVLVVMVSGAIFLTWQHWDLEAALVSDVIRLSQPRSRPVHRVPDFEVTTFQECLGPLLDAPPDAPAFAPGASEDLRSIRAAIREGRLSVDSLPGEVEADRHAASPWAHEVASCALAPAVGTADGLGPFASWSHPRQRAPMQVATTATEVLMLELRQDVYLHRPETALETCSDLLALSRDLVHDRGLVGAAVMSRTVRMALAPCVEALGMGDVAARQRFLKKVRAIRSGIPALATIVEVERTQMQLAIFGMLLSSNALEKLPSDARELATRHEASSDAQLPLLFYWLYWPEYVDRMRRLSAAVTKPNREDEIKRLDAEWFWLRHFAGPGTEWVRLARWYDGIHCGLDLLESAASYPDTELNARVRAVRADEVVELSLQCSSSETLSVTMRTGDTSPARAPGPNAPH